MKKLLLVLRILAIVGIILGSLSAGIANAVTVTWEHNGVNTLGFIIYFWETDIPGVIYNDSVDVSVRELFIDDNRFIVGTQYSFMGVAYNASTTSADSEIVNYVFEGEAYKPPDVNLPPEQNPEPPNAPTGMKLESALFKYVPE